MLKYKKVLGIPVLSLDEGKVLGEIEDVFFNIKNGYVVGLYVHKGLKKQYINLADVKEVDNKVIVKSMKEVKKSGKEMLEIPNILSGRKLLNKNVFTNNGNNIGYVSDICFDVEFGSMDAIEIADGFFEDVISGRKIVPLSGDFLIKDEGVFITREAYEDIIDSNKERRKNF